MPERNFETIKVHKDYSYLKKPLKIHLNENIDILLKLIEQKPPYDDDFYHKFFVTFRMIENITSWTMPDNLVKEVDDYLENLWSHTPAERLKNIDKGFSLAKKYIDNVVFQEE